MSARFRGNRSIIGALQSAGGIIDMTKQRVGGGETYFLWLPRRFGTTHTGGFNSYTCVSRIPTSLFVGGVTGSEVRVVTAYATSGAIYKGSVSTAAASGDSWDSASDLVSLTWNGSATITTPNPGIMMVSDWMPLVVDGTKDIVVATLGSTGSSTDYYANAEMSGAAFWRKNVDEVATQDRGASYTSIASNSAHAWVEVR